MKNIFLALFCMTLFVVSGCTQNGGDQQRMTDSNQSVETSRELMKEAVTSSDDDKCKGIEDNRKRNSCLSSVYNALAMEKLDTGYCGKLPSDIEAQGCERSVIYKKSTTEDKMDLCNKLKGEVAVQDCKDNYYGYVAVQKNDQIICNSIKHNEARATCIDQVVYQGLSIEGANGGSCTQVTNPEVKEMCNATLSGILMYKEAVGEGNKEKCAEIADVNLKEFCEQEAVLASNNKDLCDELSEDFTYGEYAKNRNYKKECMEKEVSVEETITAEGEANDEIEAEATSAEEENREALIE